MTTQVASLDEAKAHLNITSTTQDEELLATLDAAIASAEGFLGGALLNRTETVRLPGSTFLFYLPVRPVLSVESVVDSWTSIALDTTGLWIDSMVGRVALTPFGNVPLGYFPPDITVNYTVGWPDPLPYDIREGVLELCRHKWETQRGSGTVGRPTPGLDEQLRAREETFMVGFPDRVKEALGPHRLPIA